MTILQGFLIGLLVIGLLRAEEFTNEEREALEELRKAGLLEVNAEKLIEDIDNEYDVETPVQDEIPDEVSERGGPRRQRRPTNKRNKQGLRLRPNAFQFLASSLFSGAGSRDSRPAINYGQPKHPSYGPPKQKPL